MACWFQNDNGNHDTTTPKQHLRHSDWQYPLARVLDALAGDAQATAEKHQRNGGGRRRRRWTATQQEAIAVQRLGFFCVLVGLPLSPPRALAWFSSSSGRFVDLLLFVLRALG
jgi:hypothetical protein